MSTAPWATVSGGARHQARPAARCPRPALSRWSAGSCRRGRRPRAPGAPPRPRASGWRACTIGRTRPEAISGQTCSRTAATIVAFSAAGRARSVVAMTAPRLAQQRPRCRARPRAALHADDDEPAARGQGSDVAGQVLRPHDVEDDVGAVPVGRRHDALDEVLLAVVRSSTSAPSSRHASSFAADPAVTMTRAPTCRASWIAMVPMPDDPPCTSSVSPGWRFAT